MNMFYSTINQRRTKEMGDKAKTGCMNVTWAMPTVKLLCVTTRFCESCSFSVC